MTNSSKASGNRGRPPDPAKREAIITAASELFLESELGDISMDAVAKKANVSKITVYKHFSDKRELFQTMIENKMEANLSSALFARLEGVDAFQDLVTIAKGFTNIIYSKDGVNMYRTVVAESKRGVDIPHMFYAKAIEPSNNLLAAHLHKLEQAGEYAFPDKLLAATIFFSIFKGDRFMRATMTIPPHDEDSETEGFVKQIVGLYLKMFKLPEQKTIVASKEQHYQAQLYKLSCGIVQCKQPFKVAAEYASNPQLKTVLKQTDELLVHIGHTLQLLSEQQTGKTTQSASATLVAMYKEAETEMTQYFATDALRDNVISSHCFRILQFLSTCFDQLMTTAESLQMETAVLRNGKQQLLKQTSNLKELPFE